MNGRMNCHRCRRCGERLIKNAGLNTRMDLPDVEWYCSGDDANSHAPRVVVTPPVMCLYGDRKTRPCQAGLSTDADREIAALRERITRAAAAQAAGDHTKCIRIARGEA